MAKLLTALAVAVLCTAAFAADADKPVPTSLPPSPPPLRLRSLSTTGPLTARTEDAATNKCDTVKCAEGSKCFLGVCRKLVVAECKMACPEGSKCSRGQCVKPQMCCRAMTAQCLACGQGVTVAEYCKVNSNAIGCKPVPAKCEKAAERCPVARCMAPPEGCKAENPPQLFQFGADKKCCPRLCFFVNDKGEQCKPEAGVTCTSSYAKRALAVAQNTTKGHCAKDAGSKLCAIAQKNEAAAKEALKKWAAACNKDAAEEEKGAKTQASGEVRQCKGKLTYYENQNETASKYLAACKAKASRPAREAHSLAAMKTASGDMCAKAAAKAKEAAAGIAAVRKACAGVIKVEAGFPVKDDSKREAFEQYKKLRDMIDTCSDDCEELKAKLEELQKVRVSLSDDEKASLANATALAKEAIKGATASLKQCRIKAATVKAPATSVGKPAASATKATATKARRAALAKPTAATDVSKAKAATSSPTRAAVARPEGPTKPVECKMPCEKGSKCVRGRCMKALVGVRKEDPCKDEVEALTLAKHTLESLNKKAAAKRKESAEEKKDGARDLLAFAAKALAKAEAALDACKTDCEVLTLAVATAKKALAAAEAAEATAEGDAVAAAQEALVLAATEYVYSEGDEGDVPLLAAGPGPAATDGNSTGTGNTEEGATTVAPEETTTAAATSDARVVLAAAKKAHLEAGCDKAENAETEKCKLLSAAVANAQKAADAEDSSAAAVASTAAAVALALAVALM